MISGQSLQWYTTGCSSIPAKEFGVADPGPRKTMESWISLGRNAAHASRDCRTKTLYRGNPAQKCCA